MAPSAPPTGRADACLVTTSVLARRARIGRLVRQATHDPGDSGWRVLAHTDSEAFINSRDCWRIVTIDDVAAMEPVLSTVWQMPVGTDLQVVRDEQVRLPYFNLATAPLSGDLRASILPGGEGCWDTREILSSFRMDQSGRLVFGSVGALRNTGQVIHPAWARRASAGPAHPCAARPSTRVTTATSRRQRTCDRPS